MATALDSAVPGGGQHTVDRGPHTALSLFCMACELSLVFTLFFKGKRRRRGWGDAATIKTLRVPQNLKYLLSGHLQSLRAPLLEYSHHLHKVLLAHDDSGDKGEARGRGERQQALLFL